MQIKIFTIPIGAEDTQIEELNHFLRVNKIIDVKRELASIEGRDCWSFCITYLLPNKPIEPEKPRVGSGSKTDYKKGHGDRYEVNPKFWVSVPVPATRPQLSNEDKYMKYNEQNNYFSNISAIINDGIWAEIVGGVV